MSDWGNTPQYRITARNANYRQEPSLKGPVITVLRQGTIVNLDYERQPDGEWYPVLLVRGWVHKSVIEALE